MSDLLALRGYVSDHNAETMTVYDQSLVELLNAASVGFGHVDYTEDNFGIPGLTFEESPQGEQIAVLNLAFDEGDSLGRFICIEIMETFDTHATRAQQAEEAVRVMESALRNINYVIARLEDVLVMAEREENAQ